MADLCFTAPELTVDFDQGLGFKAATEEIVDGLNLGAEFLNFTSALEEGITGNESTDVGHLLGSGDDLGRHGFTEFGFFSQVGRRHDSEAQEFLKSGFSELFGGGRSHAGQVFDGLLDLLFFGH